MAKRRSAKSLVDAILQGRVDLDGAIQQHLDENYQGPQETPSLEEVQAALSYFNRGQLDRTLDLPGGLMTVAQAVKEFDLEPFAPMLDDQEPDRNNEIRYPVGALVDFYGDACRVIGRRKVTIYAMPRDDDFEVFIEKVDGEPLYFVGESMVETPEEGDQ